MRRGSLEARHHGAILTTLHTSDRQRLIQLIMLTLLAVFVSAARTIIAPLQEVLAADLRLSDQSMAVLQGPALAVPVVLAGIPLGIAVDRSKRVNLLFGLTLICAIGAFATAVSVSFMQLIFARSMVGLSAMGAATTSISLIADLYPPTQRGRAKAMLVIGQYGGMSAAFAFGGLLADYLGSAGPGWRWSAAIVATPLIPSLAMFVAMREPPRAERLAQKPSFKVSAGELWMYRHLCLTLIGGITLIETAFFGILTWAAPSFTRVYQLSAGQIGSSMALVVLVGGLAGPALGGMLADGSQKRSGSRGTLKLLAIVAFAAALVGAMVFASTATIGLILLVLLTTMISAGQAIGMTLFTIVIPNEIRGLCISVLATSIALVSAGIGPMLVAGLSALLDGSKSIATALAIVISSSCILSAALFQLGSRQRLFAEATPKNSRPNTNTSSKQDLEND